MRSVSQGCWMSQHCRESKGARLRGSCMNASGPSNVWCPSVSILRRVVHHVGEFQIVPNSNCEMGSFGCSLPELILEPQSIPGEVKVRRATESF